MQLFNCLHFLLVLLAVIVLALLGSLLCLPGTDCVVRSSYSQPARPFTAVVYTLQVPAWARPNW